jgi:hypothetical protein
MKEIGKLLVMLLLIVLLGASCSDNKTEFINRYENTFPSVTPTPNTTANATPAPETQSQETQQKQEKE